MKPRSSHNGGRGRWALRGGLTLLALGLSTAACGQTALGQIGGGCATVDAQNQITVTLTSGLSVGNQLVIAIAASDPLISDLTVIDSAGTTYRPLGGRRTRTAGNSLALLLGQPPSTLLSGGTLRVRASAAQTGTFMCATLHAFSDLVSVLPALRSRDATAGNDAAPTTTHTADGEGAEALVFGAFSFAANPGSLTSSNGATVQQAVCSSDQSLCLASGYKVGAVTGNAAVALTTASAVEWRVVSAAVAREALFRDGFE